MVLCDLELIEDSVGLPPPMVFCLSEFGFSIVAETVRPICVGAFQARGSVGEMKAKVKHNTIS